MKQSTKIIVSFACLFEMSLGFMATSIIQSIFASDVPWLAGWSEISGEIAIVLLALVMASAIPSSLLLGKALSKEWREEELR